MIENGQMIFSGTIEQFDNYIQPNTLLLELDTPPMECDLMLPGISKVETLSERRFRLRYDGDRIRLSGLPSSALPEDGV